MVISHIKAFAASLERLYEFWISVAQVVGTTVQMQINQTMTVHVVKVIPFTSIDHEIDPHVLPVLGLARVPEGSGPVEKV